MSHDAGGYVLGRTKKRPRRVPRRSNPRTREKSRLACRKRSSDAGKGRTDEERFRVGHQRIAGRYPDIDPPRGVVAAMKFPETGRFMNEAVLPVGEEIDEYEVEWKRSPPANLQDSRVARPQCRQNAGGQKIADPWDARALDRKSTQVDHPVPTPMPRNLSSPQNCLANEEEGE